MTFDVPLNQMHSEKFPIGSDEYYMGRCLELARKGAGMVSPNPMVGAILVYNNRIIGEGYHAQYGQSHAEVNCIHAVRAEDRQYIPESTLYVTLEPCSHFGKTPPCANFILDQHIKHVVIGIQDYSHTVNGKGIQLLQQAGVQVRCGIRERDCFEINKRFFTFHQCKRPYVVLKWAQSKEGFIGNLQQRVKLSSPETDTLVHQWRAEEDAIWVGYRTIQTDNPQLNVRLVEGKQPIRIFFDRDNQLDRSLHVFDDSQKTIVFNTHLNKQSGNTSYISISDQQIIPDILHQLFRLNCLSVLVEGGRGIVQQLIHQHLWDEARVIQTPTRLPDGVAAPVLHHHEMIHSFASGNDQITYYRNTKRRCGPSLESEI
jgi:diaminohydroxyphosphoribosylaminopyrimidine deaminase/5-amino-6-(5-phosphoribosylamino)uracil reductase